MEYPGDWLLIVLVLTAGFLDLKTRRIPNWLTVSGFATALAFRLPYGTGPVLDGLIAGLIAFGLSLPFFALGGLGGGDVKLLAAVGAFLGVDRLWMALFVTAMVGGALALIAVIRRRRLGTTIANMYMVMRSVRTKEAYTGWKGAEGDAPLTIRSAGVITRPYAVAIAAGALYAVLPFF
jgi:prepilin peptidase CpaA